MSFSFDAEFAIERVFKSGESSAEFRVSRRARMAQLLFSATGDASWFTADSKTVLKYGRALKRHGPAFLKRSDPCRTLHLTP